MIEPKHCPECDSYKTTRQMMEEYSDHIEVVRTCDECPTQFVVNYGDPRIKDVVTYE